MGKLTMTLEQLENILREQKRVTADYITRNLTTYTFYNQNPGIDNKLAKDELRLEVMKSGYPDDFERLKKYIK